MDGELKGNPRAPSPSVPQLTTRVEEVRRAQPQNGRSCDPTRRSSIGAAIARVRHSTPDCASAGTPSHPEQTAHASCGSIMSSDALPGFQRTTRGARLKPCLSAVVAEWVQLYRPSGRIQTGTPRRGSASRDTGCSVTTIRGGSFPKRSRQIARTSNAGTARGYAGTHRALATPQRARSRRVRLAKRCKQKESRDSARLCVRARRVVDRERLAFTRGSDPPMSRRMLTSG
jgi:hypothetical protein